jgi:hypothetical protein
MKFNIQSAGVVFLVLIFCGGCEKYRQKKKAERYTGTYIGTTSSTIWTLGNGSAESSYADTIQVVYSEGYINFRAISIPIEELEEGEEYWQGGSNDLRTATFDNIHLDYYEHYGSPGGGSTYIFSGNKQ